MTPTDPATIPGRNCAPPANPEWWFPPEGNTTLQRRATKNCRGCVALETCLAWALHHEAGKPRSARSGIYGGLTPPQRARLQERGAA